MPNPEILLAVGRQAHFPPLLVHEWQYGDGSSITNSVPQVTKEVTWLSSWKSLAVEETDYFQFFCQASPSPGQSGLAGSSHVLESKAVQTVG